jgi:hypothetical protein
LVAVEYFEVEKSEGTSKDSKPKTRK